jgi:signal transduction histidine kinase
MRQDTNNHKFVLRLNCTENLIADKERIGQVLTNLISNAIKYSPHGGEIILSCEMKGKCVEVSISDYGIGIPEECLEGIFERFYRVLSTEARTFPGMGIGLSICKDIIEMHKGKIEVESKQNIGSTFRFIIPTKHTEEK